MTLADHAQTYAAAGIAVFPLQPREKKPFGHSSGLLSATHDPARVAQWWAGQLPLPLRAGADPRRPVYANPRANIGVATGEASGFWVLDIDGPDGAAALAALESGNGALPPTPEQSTGKGRHICFAWPEGREVRNSASKIGTGIDVRGNGGYIVAAPSIHPSGRAYAWVEGRGPGDLRFAAAPEWLLAMVERKAEPIAPATPHQHTPRIGQASTYGEAALTGACRDIAAAAPGTQMNTLWTKALHVGALVAGGEIDRGYAESAVIAAGLSMATSKGPWTHKEVAGNVDRAFAWAEKEPRTAPQREPRHNPRAPSPTYRKSEPQPRRDDTPADARQIWAAALHPGTEYVESALARGHGLDLDLNGWRTSLRLANSPGARPDLGHKTLLLPLSAGKGCPLDGLAMIPLFGDTLRVTGCIGLSAGLAGVVSPFQDATDALADLLVAIDLSDAWSLGAAAQASGDPLGVVLAPSLSAFSGKPKGDTWGRVSVDTPASNPDHSAWTVAGPRQVYLAVRNDLFGPQLKVRKLGGGSAEVRLTGEDAASFYGALASQSWTRAGAAGVRILRPRGGLAGFHTVSGGPA